MDAPVEQVPDLIDDDVDYYSSGDEDAWLDCPKCNPARFEGLARDEEFIEQMTDYHKAGRTATRANFMKEKMARKNARSAPANRDHVKINASKTRKTTNRQSKKRKIVTAEIAHDNMSTRYDSWSFFVNPQAPQSFANYLDPEEVDSVCYDSDYQWWLTFGSGSVFDWDYDEQFSESVEDSESLKNSEEDLVSFDISSENCRDFRSKRKDENRVRKQKKKYYDYRGSRPERVGKLYYDITLTVPENINADEKSAKSKRKRKMTERSVPKEVEDLDLFKEFQGAYWGWLAWELPGYLRTAGKFANDRNRLSGAPKPQVGTLMASPALDKLLEDYKSFAGRYSECYSGPRALLKAHPMARFRLKVQEWTKNDNFDDRTEFKEHWHIKRRHHSSKLTRDGKHYRKNKLRELGRSMKSRSRQLDAAGSPVDILRSSSSAQIMHEDPLHGHYCWCEDYFSLEEYLELQAGMEIEESESLAVSEFITDDSSRSDVVVTSSSAVDVNQDEIRAAISKLVEDGWVLFDDGSSDNLSITDIDRLSDLEEMLGDSDWERLSHTSDYV